VSKYGFVSARAVRRSAKVAGPFQVANNPPANVAKDITATDRIELRIGQSAQFRVRQLHALRNFAF
jgi:hypothetical protein